MKKLTFAIAFVVVIALLWPLAPRLTTHHTPTAFSASHAWVAEHLWRALTGEHTHSPTADAGYPFLREARYIGWVPSVATWFFRPLLGPIGAFNLVQLLSLPASAVAAWPLLRRWTDAEPPVIAAACLVYGLCPFLVSTLGVGETPNLQAWGLPLVLYGLDRVFSGERRYAALVLALSLATSLSSPYYGLLLPLLALGFAAFRVRKAPMNVGVGLAAVALALAPGLLYFRADPGPVPDRLFRPAAAGPTGGELPVPYPVATLDGLFTGPPFLDRSPYEVVHVGAIGALLPLALLALGLRQRGRGWRAGLALAIGGVLLALGPTLAIGDHFTGFTLPSMALVRVGYPYVRGGLWFRLILVASLGLAVLLAALSARGRRGAALAWLLASAHVVEGARMSGPWPWPVAPVPGLALLHQMRAATGGGAVLHLPLQEGPNQAEGQMMLLAAAVHGRPTTALPRDAFAMESNAIRRILLESLEKPDPARALRAVGFRYVVFQPMPGASSSVRRELLEQKLGPPQGDSFFAMWDLGPTATRALSPPSAQAPPRSR